MSDLSFERYRRDKKKSKINILTLCQSSVELSQIKWLCLTYFFALFPKS